MATRSLGALTLDLLLKTGGFKAGMDQAAREAARGSQEIAAQMKKAAKLTDAMRTPLEVLMANLKEYKRLATDPSIPAAYRITQQTLERATQAELALYKQRSAAHQAWASLQAEAKAIIEGQRSATENLIRTEQRLIGMMKLKLLTQEQVNAEMAKQRSVTPDAMAGAAIRAQQVTPVQIRDTSIAEAVRLAHAGTISIAEMNAEIARARQEYHETSAAGKEFIAMEERMKSALAATETALERHTREMRDYDTALKRNIIDQAEFNKLAASSRATLAASTQNVGRATSSLATFGATLLRQASGFVTVYAAYAGARKILTIANDYALLENRLRLVTKSGGELARVQKELFDVAQRTRSEYEGVVNLYSKLALTQKDLGATQSELVTFTEAVGNALTISGTSAQTARGALTQLAQGLASGTFRAEEFNAVLEGSPEIIRIVARNIERFHGSVGALRLEVAASKLGSQEFFRAFLAGADELKQRVAQLPLTISQAFQQLENAFGRAVSQGGNVQPLVDAIKNLKDTIEDPGVQEGIAAIASLIVGIATAAAEAAAKVGEIAGLFADAAVGIGMFAGSIADAVEEVSYLHPLLRLMVGDLKDLKDLKPGSILDEFISHIPQLQGGLLILREIQKLSLQRPADVDPRIGQRTRGAYVAPVPTVPPPNPQAQKEIENAREAILKLLDSMKQQIAVTNETQEATMRYRIEFGDLADEFRKAGPAFAKYRDELIRTARQLDQFKAGEELKKANEALEQQIVDIEATRIEQTQGTLAAEQYREAHGELAKTIHTARGELDAYGKLLATPQDATQGFKATAEAVQGVAQEVETLELVWSKSKDAVVSFGTVTGQTLQKVTGDVANMGDQVAKTLSQRQQLIIEVTAKNLPQQMEDIRKQLLEEMGDAGGAARMEVEQQFRPLKANLQALIDQGPTPTISIDVILNAKQALAQLKQVEQLKIARAELLPIDKQIDTIRTEYGRKEQTLQTRIETGVISEIRARKELIGYHQEEAEKLKKLADAYRTIAYQSGIPELIEQSKELDETIQNLKTTTDEFKKVFADAFETGLADSLFDLSKGVTSLEDAAVKFLGGIQDEILHWASQQVAAAVRDALFGDVKDATKGLFTGTGGGFAGLKDMFKGLFGIKPADSGLEEIKVSAQQLPMSNPALEAAAAGLQTGTAALTSASQSLQQTSVAAFAPAAQTLQGAADALLQAAQALQKCECVSMTGTGALQQAARAGTDLEPIVVTAARLPERGPGGPTTGGALGSGIVSTGQEGKELARDLAGLIAGLIDPKLGLMVSLIKALSPMLGGPLLGDVPVQSFMGGGAAPAAAGGVAAVAAAAGVPGAAGAAGAVDATALTTAATALATATTALGTAMAGAATALTTAATALSQAASQLAASGGSSGATSGLASLFGAGGGGGGLGELEPIIVSAKYIREGGLVRNAPSGPIIVPFRTGGLARTPPQGQALRTGFTRAPMAGPIIVPHASSWRALDAGGLIRGPGTGTSDSIPSLLSDFEFVMPAKQVARPGMLDLLETLRRGQFHHLPKFADGGLAEAHRAWQRELRQSRPVSRPVQSLVAPARFAGGGLASVNSHAMRVSDLEMPSMSMAGGKTVTQHVTNQFYFEQPQSRQTQLQLAAAAARGLKRADTRNN